MPRSYHRAPPLPKTKAEILKRLLGTDDVWEIDRDILEFAAGTTPIVLPRSIDPYWTSFGSNIGWQFLDRREWPRCVSRTSEPPRDEPYPLNSQLREFHVEGWTDAHRQTWPKPKPAPEPEGLMPWEVLADFRFLMRIARRSPESFYAFRDGPPGALSPRALTPEEVELRKVRDRLHALRIQQLEMVAPIYSTLGSRPRRMLGDAIRALDHAIESVEDDCRAVDERARDGSQHVRWNFMTHIDLTPYRRPSRGRPPVDALIVHAAVQLFDWKREYIQSGERHTERRVLKEQISRDDDLAIAWLITAVMALDDEGKKGLEHWKSIVRNYRSKAKTQSP